VPPHVDRAQRALSAPGRATLSPMTSPRHGHVAGPLRRIAAASVLAVFAFTVTVGVALACSDRGGSACGPVRIEGAPDSLNVGVEVGGTCVEPGITDYVVSLSGPGDYLIVIAQGSVNPPNPIIPPTVLSVPSAGTYTITVSTTTNSGETQTCVSGTTTRSAQVPAKAATPTPEPSPSESPSPKPTKKPTPEPSADVTEAPTDEPTDEPTEAPTDEVTEPPASEEPLPSEPGVATFDPNPSISDASPTPTPTPAGGGGTGGGGGPDPLTLTLVGVIVLGGVGAAAAGLLYLRQSRLSAEAPWRAGPWKCARCNAINREGTERCRRCYARWDGTP